jgi:Family of unknown function (DUF6263)
MRKYFVSLVCVAAMVGCKKDQGAATGSGAASAGSNGSAAGSGSATAGSGSAAGSAAATAPTDKPGVKVLDQGSEPRVKLTYKIPQGTKQAFEMSVDMGMDMGAMGGKMKVPSMNMQADVEFPEVAADGGMKYKLVTHDLKFVDTPGARVSASMLNAKLAGMGDMEATGTLAPSGKVSDFNIEMKNAPPQIKQMMGNLKQSYDQMVTQLPDEPIGKGGRWQVVATMDQNGVKATQTAVFEVEDISDSVVKLKSTVTVAAPAQTINSGGMSVQLKRMTGTGSGNITLDLTKLIGASDMTLHIDEDLEAMGKSMSMAMDMTMKWAPK